MFENRQFSLYLKPDEMKKLNFLCEITGMSRSSLMRDLIDSAYDEIQKMDGLFIDDEKKTINKEFNVLDLLNNLSKEIQSLKNQVVKK